MTYKVIAIPGGTTNFEDAPIVIIRGGGDHPVTLTIQYHASEIHDEHGPKFGEITFDDIFEYRFVDEMVSYLDLGEDFGGFTLIEVENSKLLKELAAHEAGEDQPGTWYGDNYKRLSPKHYRLVFDHYGRFEVIALKVTVKEIDKLVGS